MKKTKLICLLSTLMLLSACGNPTTSSASTVKGTSTPTVTTSKPTTAGTPTSEEEEVETEFRATGVDIITESNKVYIQVKGTSSGYTAAEKMKFAFALVSREGSGTDSTAGTVIVGNEYPEGADFKYVPTLAADGTWEIKFDVTDVKFEAGIFNVVAGPEDHCDAISLSNLSGTHDAKVNGHRIYVRSDMGAIAADKLPPMALTDSFVKVEDGKVYHYIGGTISMSETEFKALDPFLLYETTVGSWKQTRMDDQDPNPVSLVVIDGKGYVKCEVTDLPEDRYNVKLNLNEKVQADTQMETIINDEDKAIKLNGKAYYVYADKTHAGDKNHIYGNLGLVVAHYHDIVNDGDKVGQVQKIKCVGEDIKGFELKTDSMTSGQVPDLNNTNTRLGKGSVMENVWDITGVESGKYSIQLYCAGKDAGTLDSHWDGRIDIANKQPAANHGGDKAGYRYTFKAGDGEYVEPTTTKTMRETGMGLAADGWNLTEEIGTIMISETDTTFSIKNMDNGYASFIQGVRLVRVGNYVAPAKDLTFTDNKAKIEAEDYNTISANASLTKTEEATVSGGKYLAGFDSYGEEAYYRFKITEEATVNVTIAYSCYEENNGYGAIEFYVDGTKVQNVNFGELNGEATAETPVWATVVVEGIELSTGEHEIKIRTPWGAKTDFDYFELAKVTAA